MWRSCGNLITQILGEVKNTSLHVCDFKKILCVCIAIDCVHTCVNFFTIFEYMATNILILKYQ
jgi:hypothetical protein